MIKGIGIKNFRCFGNTRIDGFQRINLIGGLNNSGKTVLLEAILLNASPTPQHISLLKQLRGENMDDKEFPEYFWDNFFINQDKSQSIFISTTEGKGRDERILIMDCDNGAKIFEHTEQDAEWNDIGLQSLISTDLASRSVLYFSYKIGDKLIPALLMAAHSKGVYAKGQNMPTYGYACFYIPAASRQKPAELARDFSIVEKRGKEKKVLRALQIIDKDIEAMKVSVIGGTHIEIKRKGGSFMSASLYGDSINKILSIVLTALNTVGAILLIDEIENGLHHTIQKDFWRFLFELVAVESFDIQVFSTTHSLEMMDAFAEVSRLYPGEGAYIELFRRKATGEIDFNLHDSETLSYELSSKMAVRGE